MVCVLRAQCAHHPRREDFVTRTPARNAENCLCDVLIVVARLVQVLVQAPWDIQRTACGISHAVSRTRFLVRGIPKDSFGFDAELHPMQQRTNTHFGRTLVLTALLRSVISANL